MGDDEAHLNAVDDDSGGDENDEHDSANGTERTVPLVTVSVVFTLFYYSVFLAL